MSKVSQHQSIPSIYFCGKHTDCLFFYTDIARFSKPSFASFSGIRYLHFGQQINVIPASEADIEKDD